METRNRYYRKHVNSTGVKDRGGEKKVKRRRKEKEARLIWVEDRLISYTPLSVSVSAEKILFLVLSACSYRFLQTGNTYLIHVATYATFGYLS